MRPVRGPVGGEIKSRLIGLRSVFSIAAYIGIDDLGIQHADIFVCQPQRLTDIEEG